MSQRVPLLEVVKKIHALQRDLDYTRKLQERMVDKQSRFPMIFNGITRQIEFLQRKLDELKELDIDVAQTGLFDAAEDPASATNAKTQTADPVDAVGADALSDDAPSEDSGEIDLDLDEEHPADQAAADVNAAESAAHAVESEDAPVEAADNNDRRSKFAALAARSRGRKLGRV